MSGKITRHRVVLLLGATGFIGRRLMAALAAAGYTVICGVRDPSKLPACRSVRVDYDRDHAESDWLPRVVGIDVVVNAVGVLRETGDASFEALHVAAPRALFSACARAGIEKIVQISALGADQHAASGYHRSKREADDVLANSPVPWVIVQPSLVFGDDGRSASLFTRLAALPLIPVPGDGSQLVQPVHIDDLAAAVVRVIETSEYDRTRLAAVGPRPLTFAEFLQTLRKGMGLGDARILRVPMTLMRAAATVSEKLPRALLDRESLGMLVRGNVASPAAMSALLGRPTRPVDAFIETSSSRAIANEARLGWLLPLLRVAVALVWIVTGIVSLGIYPTSDSYALLARVGLTGTLASIALYGAAALDIALGAAVFAMRRRRWLWRAQMLVILGYTALITFFLPEFWLHPYGPVLKNLPLLATIAVLHEFDAV